MKEVKSIGIMSAAKVSAVLSAIWGFIAAVIGIAFLAPMAAYAGQAAGFAFAGPLMLGLGIASLIIVPILMAVIGFIMGAIGAFLYNVVAKYVGGVKLDL